MGSAAFGIDIGLGSETAPLAAGTPAQLDREAQEPGAPLLGLRIRGAFETILATTRPSKSGVWLPLILMTHPSLRDPVRILANVRGERIGFTVRLKASGPIGIEMTAASRQSRGM